MSGHDDASQEPTAAQAGVPLANLPRPSQRQKDVATMGTLRAVAVSSEALHLQRWLAALVIEHEARQGVRKRARRAAALENFERAIGALVADLLAAHRDAPEGGLIYISRNSQAISKGPQTYDALITTFATMRERDLIEEFEGHFRERNLHFDGVGPVSFMDKKAARFRATPTLLTLVEGLGIDLFDLDTHFKRPGPNRLLSLRAKSNWMGGHKLKGALLPLPETAEMKAQAARVAAINAFVSGVEIGGGGHRSFFRAFAMGDQPGFAWDKGGRLYSEGRDNYQQLPEARRGSMTLNGEPVVEIDIKASFLTILHGLAGAPFEMGDDAYAFAHQSRNIAKAWLTASLGSGKHISRWPKPTREAYLEEHGVPMGSVHSAASVGSSMIRRFPLLSSLPSLGLSWAELMYVEAEAIIASMEDLQSQGVPALPVHDSLIVPVTASQAATTAVEVHYLRHAKIVPKLHIKRSPQETPFSTTTQGLASIPASTCERPVQQPHQTGRTGQRVTIRPIYRRPD